jgi:hypothetical protein
MKGCESCDYCGTWKGQGTHGPDHGKQAHSVVICNHGNGCRREILNKNMRPVWCPIFTAAPKKEEYRHEIQSYH